MLRAILFPVLCLASVSPAMAQALEWAKIPRMILERQYAGPLQDTIIQRWRDPVDGSTCYIYLPFSAPFTAPATGYVQYGSSTIGSISCTVKSTPGPIGQQAPAPAPAAAKGAKSAPEQKSAN